MCADKYLPLKLLFQHFDLLFGLKEVIWPAKNCAPKDFCEISPNWKNTRNFLFN